MRPIRKGALTASLPSQSAATRRECSRNRKLPVCKPSGYDHPAVPPNRPEGSPTTLQEWQTSRSGAWAARGFNYQHLVSTLMLVRRWAGVAPSGYLVPEGFDDCVIETVDSAFWIQAKSRHEGMFRKSEFLATIPTADGSRPDTRNAPAAGERWPPLRVRPASSRTPSACTRVPWTPRMPPGAAPSNPASTVISCSPKALSTRYTRRAPAQRQPIGLSAPRSTR